MDGDAGVTEVDGVVIGCGGVESGKGLGARRCIGYDGDEAVPVHSPDSMSHIHTDCTIESNPHLHALVRSRGNVFLGHPACVGLAFPAHLVGLEGDLASFYAVGRRSHFILHGDGVREHRDVSPEYGNRRGRSGIRGGLGRRGCIGRD